MALKNRVLAAENKYISFLLYMKKVVDKSYDKVDNCFPILAEQSITVVVDFFFF